MKIVWHNIGVDRPVSPDEPVPDLPQMPSGAIVVLTGRAPIWRYGIVWHQLHGSAAAVVAVYDPKLGGAVVISSHAKNLHEGDVIPDLISPG